MRAFQTSVGLISAMFLAVTAVTATRVEAQNPATFTSDIRPIMERSCWDCHGEEVQRSGLDLRTRDDAILGGRNGAAIVPGRAEESLLYRMIVGLEEPLMPRDGPSLSAAEIAAVRAWIDGGAHWDDGPTVFLASNRVVVEELPPGARDAWAFQLPVQGTVPEASPFEHPIDRFLEQTRRAQGLTAAPRADRRTLLRRAHLDLIGLPPTPEETAEFLADSRPDAWERLIERLLASPPTTVSVGAATGSTQRGTRTRTDSSRTTTDPTPGDIAITSFPRSIGTSPSTASSRSRSPATSWTGRRTRPGSPPGFCAPVPACTFVKRTTRSGGTSTWTTSSPRSAGECSA